MTTAPTPANRAAPRRKPRQSRAVHTAQALREAFVRLLIERSYASITIREITALAGTGLGSFYEYFASKEDLVRVCLHLRSKALLMAMHEAIARATGRPFAAIVDAVVAALIDAHRDAPREWAAHYVLERHLSPPDVYRKMYERFVDEWLVALQAAGELDPGSKRRDVARVSQTITYGLFAHSHIVAVAGEVDLETLRWQLQTALVGHLDAVAADVLGPVRRAPGSGSSSGSVG